MEGSDFVDLLKKLYHHGTRQADAHYGSLTDNHGLKGFTRRRFADRSYMPHSMLSDSDGMTVSD